MTLDPTAACRLYDEAWTVPDYETRLASLRTIWADDGLYVDPDVPEGVRGPEAPATVIAEQLELYPGRSDVSRGPGVPGGPAGLRGSAPAPPGACWVGGGCHSRPRCLRPVVRRPQSAVELRRLARRPIAARRGRDRQRDRRQHAHRQGSLKHGLS